ncbi:MAG: ABC transporter permease [Chloroflexi bacterium]|nr:ABC transporter permease [Chloroflexota bacterium]
MTRFIVRRLAQSAVLLVSILAGVFVLIHLTPGGPEAALLANPRIGADEVARLRQRFGLDQPLAVQYVQWVANAVRLDFGRSYFYSRPSTEVILEHLWPTLQLGVLSYLIALIGVPLGVLAALNRGRTADTLVRMLSTFGAAVPTWWLGLTCIVVLNSLIGWFPNGQGQGNPGEWLKYIILPAAVLGMSGLVSFTRFARASVLDTLGQDYVRTITEYVFAWPGVGLLFYEAATSRDYPVLLAVLTMTTFATMLGALLADVGYGLVDPRVRYA